MRGAFLILGALGLVGVVWAIVDIVNHGAGEVPGSVWTCLVLGAILAVTAFYREFGGGPLIDPVAEEAQRGHTTDLGSGQ